MKNGFGIKFALISLANLRGSYDPRVIRFSEFWVRRFERIKKLNTFSLVQVGSSKTDHCGLKNNELGQLPISFFQRQRIWPL